MSLPATPLIQKTREGCGCFWDACESSQGKIPGKSRESCRNIFPKSQNALNCGVSLSFFPWCFCSSSPKPDPSKPCPCNMPHCQAKTEVALQFSECCAAETALQHWLFCSAEVIWTKSCAAANEKLHCNIEKAALQESGAFLPLSCGFQAPTFRHPRFGPADLFPWSFSRCFEWFLLILQGF